MSNKSLKKSTTFQSNKSSSMDRPDLHRSITTCVQRKSPSVTFPTSPEGIVGDEINHFSHQHTLVQVIQRGELFTCMGCKEFGSGNRFTCRQCDYQLHEFCALAPIALKNHPLHVQHQLLFHTKPVKGGRTKCDVCSKPAKGYKFLCTACSFQMHPCCAMLSTEMNFPVHPHTLMVLPATALANGDPEFSCGECKRKRAGRVYRCKVCHYHIHAVCAKSMINGLYLDGLKGEEKQSKLGIAARFTSQVVIEFIGGLIQGIGEGVGQVLIQNMGKGRCHSGRRT